MKKQILITLMLALGFGCGAQLSAAPDTGVVINEFVAAASDRLLQRDGGGYPRLGITTPWMRAEYDDRLWATGAGPFGFGTFSGVVFGVDTSVAMQGLTPSLYLRKTFTVSAVQAQFAWRVRMNIRYNDGFIAFLNGVEVARRNMGPVHMFGYHDQPAFNARSEDVTETIFLGICSELLVEGSNLLCIQGHNKALTGTDSGSFLVLADLDVAMPLPQRLVTHTEEWKYFAGVLEPSGGIVDYARLEAKAATVPWGVLNFNDSAWVETAGPVGFDASVPPDYVLGTNLVSEMRGKAAAVYARTRFSVTSADAASTAPLQMVIDYDDALIVYLNGVEVARRNVGEANTVTPYNALAASGHNASYDGGSTVVRDETILLGAARSLLVEGDNILAIQIHNSSLTSSDMIGRVTLSTTGSAAHTLVVPEDSCRFFVGISEPVAVGPDDESDAEIEMPDSEVDWIELYNAGTQRVELAGWSLTDDADNPRKWSFPPGSAIESNGFLVVLATGVEIGADAGATYLQAGFKLASEGEYLGLYDSTGAAVSEFAPGYPAQHPFYSYARGADGVYSYCDQATPGAVNAGQLCTEVAAPPAFSAEGGFYPSGLLLQISLPVRGGQLRYTLDGSEPSLESGVLYTGPITLTSSTVVRARCFKAGLIPSAIRTHTYLIGQPASFLTLPAICINSDPRLALYGPNAVDGPPAGEGVMAIKGGIYVENIWQSNGATDAYNIPMQRGRAFEKPSSLEFFPVEGAPLRTDFGCRIAGSAYSRPRYLLTRAMTARMGDDGTQKPSFNLYFRGEFGDSPQDYPFFPGSPVTRFSDIRLRAGKNDARNPFIIDEFMRRVYLGTGQKGSRGILNTLFINGVYKGYFNLCEHLREPFMQEHFNSAELWDVRQVGEFVSGDAVHWNSMMTLLRSSNLSDPAVYAQVHGYLDVDNYIDYLLVNTFAAMWDWPNNNWVAGRERSDTGRWRFFMWDAEGGFKADRNPAFYDSFSSDLNIGAEAMTTGNKFIPAIYTLLKASPEFRLRFADRAQKHLFHSGTLTRSSMTVQFEELRDAINPVMQTTIGQSMNQSFFNNWIAADTRRNAYFPQLITHGLWVLTAAPEFSQQGGLIAAGTAIGIANPNADGTIYYSTNGIDPRAAGGLAVGTLYSAPLPIAASATLKARVRSAGGEWSPLQEAFFQVPVVMPVFLPEGSADWTADANWNSTPAPYPNGVEARALIPGPLTASREISLRQPATIHEILFDMGECQFRNRIRDRSEGNTLTFASSSGAALLTVEGTGSGFVEFEIKAGTVLATNLLVTVNNTAGDPDYGALRLRETWLGAGGLIKEGAGVATMTGDGKSYSGATAVNQGVLQITEPASLRLSSSIAVNSGGQLRLSSVGTPAEPRVYAFGGALTLSSRGRSGSLPDLPGLGVKGGLRYDPDAEVSYAVVTNAVVFSAPAGVHVEGSGSSLTLSGALSGASGFVKSGGGTLVLAADSPDYSAPVTVSNGVLEVNSQLYSAVEVAEGAVLSGCGRVGTIQGAGTVALDSELLQASAAEALHYAFSFQHTGSPAYASAAASGNALLRLLAAPTGTVPAALDIYLDCPPLAAGERLRGGFFVEGQSGLADFVAQAVVRFYVPDASGSRSFAGRSYALYTGVLPLTVTAMPEVADFGDGPRSGEVLELRVAGPPVSYREWMQLAFPAPADQADQKISGPSACPSGDGTPNLMRYAFDMAPHETAPDKRPYFVLEEGVPLYGFRFDPGKHDLTWRVEGSGTLTHWPRLLFDSRTDDLDRWDGDWIRLYDTESGPAVEPRQFYRLRIQLDEP